MHRRFCVAIILLAITSPLRAEDWPEFRGPTGQGLYQGKNLPFEWSTTKNVAWKVPIPGKGWSSPILLNNRVYLTSAEPMPGGNDLALIALCINAENSEILWKTQVFVQDGGKAPKIHQKNSHASPTPLTDGKKLYVHFGHQGTACLDLDGKILWTSTEHKYAPVHGNGGTPILVDDRLVFSGDGSSNPFVVALKIADGKTSWKTQRKPVKGNNFSFSTPLAITVAGKKQIVSPGSDAVSAFDPTDGKEIWRCTYTGYSVIPRPVFGHGMVYISTSYNSPSILAIRVDGKGDVTKTHLAWSLKKGAPHTPSLLLVGDELYTVSDGGIACCVDAKTGDVHWSERIGGAYSASPFYADDKVYFQAEDGTTTVVRAAKKYELLATSKLGERTFASYAVADGAIYLRTESQLYRLQAPR